MSALETWIAKSSMSGTVSQPKRQKRVVAWISKSNSDRNRRDKTKLGFFTDIFPL
jgi:hypothetical protein